MDSSLLKQDISVVIPVHNGGYGFKCCLQALEKLDPQPCEVIVVANGDTDGSWLVAKQFGATVLRMPEAVGPGVARNLGARVARGKYLLFIDADVEVQPSTVGQVAEAFAQHPQVTAIMGSYDDAPGAINFLSQYRNLLHHYTHQISCEDASTFWAGCGAIRREAFLSIGGFNENYRKPCIEDIELGYRLQEAGYKIRLCKHIQVKHLKHWDAFSVLKTDIFCRALPWTALILKNRQLDNDLNLKIENRISACLIYILIFSMFAGIFYTSMLLWMTVSLTFGLLLLNLSLYKFFYRCHGFKFSVKAILWHWLYYFYSSLAFAVGIIWHQFKERSSYKPMVGGQSP